MAANELDIDQIIGYWSSEAEDDLKVADHLFEKEDYSYALFFGHLAVEKILKALYVKKNREHAPPIHNLLRIAKSAGLKLEENRIEQLNIISAFNIEARYPDIKRSFRAKCTKEFTALQMRKIQEIFRWLQEMISSPK